MRRPAARRPSPIAYRYRIVTFNRRIGLHYAVPPAIIELSEQTETTDWIGNMANAITRAEHRGDYALACQLLIRRDNRRATLYHYRHPLIIAAYVPGIALWTYLLTQLLP